MAGASSLISDPELEHILDSLSQDGRDFPSPLEGVGGKEWCRNMSLMEELNVQVVFHKQNYQYF